ncbi:MAG TPA: DUF1501 domain-containing protein [Gemmataceae bacterium]|nr:DUF1501 domain-containing protein [Gemmataceae bacterium]
MFAIHDDGFRLCDGLTRREWLRVGGLGAFGLSLPALLRAGPAAAAPAPERTSGKAKACIVLFLFGGPPQHETWDPKPDAPAQIRGDLGTVATTVPGLRVGELMPHVARQARRVAVLRAVSTNDNAHSSSGYWMLTGVPHQPTNSENAKPGAPNDAPCLGGLVRRLRGDRGGLPAAVTLPEGLWNTGHIPWPGQNAGFLGRAADPWMLACDPNTPNFQVPGLELPAEVPPLRFDGRRSLLQQVNRHLDAVDRAGAFTRHDAQGRQALDLLRSAKARRAFNLDEEPPALRDRYGRNRFGQSVLLARRLVEAGVSLVQVNWPRSKADPDANPVWDTHQKNSERLKAVLMPPMDLAYAALLEDLADRGMLDSTLVVWMGEFGRSPKINGAGGRDHWGHVFSAALAGGGVRGGVVHGASDKLGGHPKEGRVAPQDVTATVFHCLGYRPDTEVHDALGRPIPVSRGEVIRQVL